ncbi:hypothetical protein [Noviherbaspirillum massiliense]|uniref:hypothetical protein n=1 Tax=Noviherbaspirillum massiliense TaxID=1465823 RepID=UPI0002DA6995|nr:hypothetical protein [Noviherbaspirillum massiliense]
MNQHHKPIEELGKADQQAARTEDNPIGIDDIGMPSGMPANEVSQLNEIRPDPGKLEQKPQGNKP